MPKLKDFAEAKCKFKTDEDTLKYFLLVELYEKHLTGKQKDEFLNANTIDSMLDVLDKNQLEHLKNLIYAFRENSAVVYGEGGEERAKQFYNEAYSKWFNDAISTDVDKHRWASINNLILTISKKEKLKTDMKDLFLKFKQHLTKFDGNLSEYKQWLVLMYVDNKIPAIDRIYDVNKLIKQLNLKRLNALQKSVEKLNISYLVAKMRYLEPYYYQTAILNIDYDKIKRTNPFNTLEYEFIKTNKSLIHKEFEEAAITLIDRIKKVIDDKKEFVGEQISGLTKSKTFDDDIKEVAEYLGGTDEVLLKRAIAEYSKLGACGSAYNNFLRKAVFLKNLLKNNSSLEKMIQFRNNISKVAEYFENHLTDKEYTVYRGMRIDGLEELLKNSSPKIAYQTDAEYHMLIIDEALLNQINRTKPIVFDEGLVSTSLNKGVSSIFFGGKKDGHVFLTITVPARSKALVLDYENIENVPKEEELLLAPKTKMKIQSIKEINGHYEIDAEVVK